MYFPMLEAKMGAGTMGSNLAGHDVFHDPFEKFTELCNKFQATSSSWNSETFIEAIHTFAPLLIQHLQDEIPTLDAKLLRKAMNLQDLEHINHRLEEIIKAETSLTENFPLAIVNNEEASGGWLIPVGSSPLGQCAVN